MTSILALQPTTSAAVLVVTRYFFIGVPVVSYLSVHKSTVVKCVLEGASGRMGDTIAYAVSLLCFALFCFALPCF